MSKEEANFSLVFNEINRFNKDLLAEIKNPVVFYGRIDVDEEKNRFKTDKDFYRTLKSFPKGCIFNGVTSFTECHKLKSIPVNTVFKERVIFRNCSSLKSISKGVVFEDDVTFFDCENIESISEDVIFNGGVEFTTIGLPVARNNGKECIFPKKFVSEKMGASLTKMKQDGKIKGNLYI